MKKNIDKIEDFDFGFSFADDGQNAKQQVEQLESARLTDQEQIDSLTNRLHSLHKAILPLLDNLCRDPDKPSILWPDRVAKIDAYRKKLQSIVEGK
jgi:hypothetical protein